MVDLVKSESYPFYCFNTSHYNFTLRPVKYKIELQINVRHIPFVAVSVKFECKQRNECSAISNFIMQTTSWLNTNS